MLFYHIYCLQYCRINFCTTPSQNCSKRFVSFKNPIFSQASTIYVNIYFMQLVCVCVFQLICGYSPRVFAQLHIYISLINDTNHTSKLIKTVLYIFIIFFEQEKAIQEQNSMLTKQVQDLVLYSFSFLEREREEREGMQF